jgi:hypothetical protein
VSLPSAAAILREAGIANWREYGRSEMRQYIGYLAVVIAAPKEGGPVLLYVPGGTVRTGVTVGPFAPAANPYAGDHELPDWHKPESVRYDEDEASQPYATRERIIMNEQATEYEHGTLGMLTALRNPPAYAVALSTDRADWTVLRHSTGQVLGYIMDTRQGEPSTVPSADENSLDYQCFTRQGTSITFTHSLRGALAAIGHKIA